MLVLLFAYLAYAVAEAADVSSILTLFVCAVTQVGDSVPLVSIKYQSITSDITSQSPLTHPLIHFICIVADMTSHHVPRATTRGTT